MFIVPGAAEWPLNSQSIHFQHFPEEILDHILRYVDFRGLRMLLHAGSQRVFRIAQHRLDALRGAHQQRPGATEQTTFNPFRPIILPWPPIEVVGKMYLGKEFVLTNTHLRDDFVRLMNSC